MGLANSKVVWKGGHIKPSWEDRAYPVIASEATGSLHWYIGMYTFPPL